MNSDVGSPERVVKSQAVQNEDAQVDKITLEDATSKENEKSNGKHDEDDGDDDESEEEAADEYVVEAILDHRSDFEDEKLRYKVKWEGYTKASDQTWELEDDLQGAPEMLQQYWKKIGGKPEPGQPKPTKKRGRQSTSSSSQRGTPDQVKRSRKTDSSVTKSNGDDMEQDVDLGNLVGFMDVTHSDWQPPPPTAGSWDSLVQSVDTVVREEEDGEIWGYLVWKEQTEDGRAYRSRAKLSIIYKACPQRMLRFYEKHLVFTSSTESINT